MSIPFIMKHIAIFASGNGTNAENIIRYFQNHENILVKIILSNKKDAYVIERARKYNVPAFIFDRELFYKTDTVLDVLKENKIDLVVLAGFLWLVPVNILQYYHNRIINIHPALLPKYGGKGFYGMIVHEAVIRSGDKESGISIHYVNEQYDAGQIIFQAQCPIEKQDTPESLAQKIHHLEYEWFPKVIEQLLQ
jgi:phosphoribosylglycinamide formyltransferase-1